MTLTRLVFLVILAAAAQPQPEPTLAAAAARLQAQDPAGAARLLESITAREPGNGRAWRLLGVAYQRGQDLDKALTAYRKALEIEPAAPQVLYNMGTAYALKHEPAAAFEWLGKAKATRKLDMTQIDTDPELSSLTSDPRVHALLLQIDDAIVAIDTASLNGTREAHQPKARLIQLTGDTELVLGTATRARWHWIS